MIDLKVQKIEHIRKRQIREERVYLPLPKKPEILEELF